ncbi:MAG: hypothetical protein HY676_06070 [Chloroflexi bacterium]|nr:hypothetical protein [Chloroflexota bacterium]
MTLAEEMRSLAQDILGSLEGRATAIAEIKRETRHLRSQTRAGLGTLHEAQETLRRELGESLAQSRSHLQSEVGATLQAFGREQKTVRQDIAGARNEWRKLSVAAHSSKGRPAHQGTASSHGMVDLGDRAFQYLTDRPKGTKMAELEKALGIPRIQMARVLKSLVEANKVKKQDLLYFAA